MQLIALFNLENKYYLRIDCEVDCRETLGGKEPPTERNDYFTI